MLHRRPKEAPRALLVVWDDRVLRGSRNLFEACLQRFSFRRKHWKSAMTAYMTGLSKSLNHVQGTLQNSLQSLIRMSISSPSISEAGPSTVQSTPVKKRAVELADSSDEDAIPNGSAFQVNGKSSVKGKKRKMVNGVKTKEKMDEERKARKLEAEKLFVKRQELPFYQGVF